MLRDVCVCERERERERERGTLNKCPGKAASSGDT